MLRAVALNTYHEKRSRAARRRMGATDSHTTARSVILPSEQAIAEGGGFNVRVGRHCVIFQCRRPCARLVPVLKRAAWTSYGEIGHEATEYEPWRGRDQRGAVRPRHVLSHRPREEGPRGLRVHVLISISLDVQGCDWLRSVALQF